MSDISLRLTIAAVTLRVDLGCFPRPGVDGARPPRGARGGISLRLLPDRLRAGLRDLGLEHWMLVPLVCGAPSGRLALVPGSRRLAARLRACVSPSALHAWTPAELSSARVRVGPWKGVVASWPRALANHAV